MTLIFFASFMALNSCDQGVGPLPECHLAELDSTSHSFSWTITELGDGGGSILRDVAIVNDTLVYAVGEINRRDSLGEWENPPYGLAIWDGHRWEFTRIIAQYPNSNVPLRPTGILAFSTTDIWFAWGDVFQWDGKSQNVTIHRLTDEITNPNPVLGPNQAVSRLWGTSGANLYGSGTSGALASYDGSSWQRLETGTTLPIRDIWGATDPVTGEQTILAIASGSSPEEGKQLLSIKGTTVTHLPDEGLSWSLSGIWFAPNCRYYVVGDGIFEKNHLADSDPWRLYPVGQINNYHSGSVRGSELNDVMIVGSFGEVLHFNGSGWYNYSSEIPSMSGAFGSVAIKGNLVAAVGNSGQGTAITVIGRR